MEALDLLEKLNRETGISFSLTEDELENPNIISRLQQLLSSVHGHNDRDFFFQQFLLGQLSAEEITSGRLKFHIEKTTNRALFLIAFKLSLKIFKADKGDPSSFIFLENSI